MFIYELIARSFATYRKKRAYKYLLNFVENNSALEIKVYKFHYLNID